MGPAAQEANVRISNGLKTSRSVVKYAVLAYLATVIVMVEF
jgi:hypothetical protein